MYKFGQCPFVNADDYKQFRMENETALANATIEALRAENARLKKTVLKKDDQIESLKGRMHWQHGRHVATQKKLEESEKKRVLLELENAGLVKTIMDVEEEKWKLEKKIKELQETGENKRLVKTIRVLTECLEDSEKKLEDLKRANYELQLITREVCKESVQMRAELKFIEGLKLGEIIWNLEQDKEDLLRDRAQLAKDAREIQKQVESTFRIFEGSHEKSQETIQSLQKSLEKCQSERDELENQLLTHLDMAEWKELELRETIQKEEREYQMWVNGNIQKLVDDDEFCKAVTRRLIKQRGEVDEREKQMEEELTGW